MSALGRPGAVTLLPGFADPVDDAQRVFRRVLGAFAEPGRIVAIDAPVDLPPGPLGRAAIGVGLALMDFETPVWFDEAAIAAAAHLRFHGNCPTAEAPDRAVFALIGASAAMPALDRFALGTDAYPDRSTTLVVEIGALADAGALTLSGPGIPGTRALGVIGISPNFWIERSGLAPLFPRGLDVILTCGDRLAALPRTTRVEV
jgi:alpha-D-ribose 1-methylphosphonate 5-triphosphate synthase subunit PhnH